MMTLYGQPIGNTPKSGFSIGKLRDHIRLMALTEDRDELGELLDTYTQIAVVNANIRVVSGRDLIRAGADIHQQIFTLQLRYRKIDSNWRIEILSGACRGTKLAISNVQPDPQRKWVILTAVTYER